MKTRTRLTALGALILTGAFLLSGCASNGATPAPEPDQTVDPGEETNPSTSATDLDFEAAWLDSGRMVAIVTQGSSSCVPIAEEATANGQTVTVLLSEGDANTACTADLASRATLVALPEGVDPTQDVTLVVTLGDSMGDTDLDWNAGLTGTPGEPTDYEPSAGWFDDDQLVLLTWGSSSCHPIVESVESEGNTGTVIFTTEDRVCTMDMAPRTTVIGFTDLADDADDDFTLTLVGDSLDATLTVIDN